MTADIQAELAAIRKLLDERMVKCPDSGEDIGMNAEGIHTEFGYRPFQDSPHATCRGTGRIPDTQYDALRNVVWALCARRGKPHWHYGQHYKARDDCGSQGRSDRFWDNMPPGALAGALFCVDSPLEIEGFDLSTFASVNPDAAAARVVREALEVKP